jgi:hypothetical protein
LLEWVGETCRAQDQLRFFKMQSIEHSLPWPGLNTFYHFLSLHWQWMLRTTYMCSWPLNFTSCSLLTICNPVFADSSLCNIHEYRADIHKAFSGNNSNVACRYLFWCQQPQAESPLSSRIFADSILRNVNTIVKTLVKERDIPEHLQALDRAWRWLLLPTLECKHQHSHNAEAVGKW